MPRNVFMSPDAKASALPDANKMECEVVVTKNGESAIRDRLSGETMHPMGPGLESRIVYLEPSRLEARLREGGPPLVLLDVGLGAATNAIGAWRISESLPESARKLEIVSFEHDLSALKLALHPDHRAAFGYANAADEAHVAATAIVDVGHHETKRTSWRLSFGDLAHAIAHEPEGRADVVFWDPFSRTVDPAVWSSKTLRTLRGACRDGVTVHTYSAATGVRAAFLLSGFAVGVGRSTGLHGETTVAAMKPADLETPLDRSWLTRLERSSIPFLPDVEEPAAAMTFIRELPQFQAD